MNHKIIQGNCRGIKANRSELLLLMTQQQPAIVFLQETFLKTDDDITIKKHQSYNFINNTGHRASSGVSVLIRNGIPQSKIYLNTQLQAIAVKVTLRRTINICSIYIPSHDAINESEINNILQQLPTPFILLGDFNSHNTMWGCKGTNHKAKLSKIIINNNNLCLFNKKSPTHLDPSSATYSAIDLTLCDTSLFLDFTWRVYDDTFPIVLESLHPQDDDLPRWRLIKANWEEFRSQFQKHFIVNNTETILEFSEKLINIAKTCIPHNPTTHKRDRP